MEYLINKTLSGNELRSGTILIVGRLDKRYLRLLKVRGYRIDTLDEINSIRILNIREQKYSLIIINNILVLLKEAAAKQLLLRASRGLVTGGRLYLNFLGKRDSWYGKDYITFCDPDEITRILSNLKIEKKIYNKGFGRTQNGSIKYWDIHGHIYLK